MDTAAAIATARKVAKVANKVIRYIREDNEASFGLDEKVSAALFGDDIALIKDGTALAEVCEITTEDGSLTITPIENGLDWGVRVTANPFPASSHLWNGPDLLKNNKYRSMLASLFHDLVWEHRTELAKAWHVSEKAVLGWGNGLLYALWMYASSDSLVGRIEARLAWEVCEFSKGWYHDVKKLLGLHSILAALMLAAGCGTPPDWRVVEIEGTNAVLRAMGKEQRIEAPAAGILPEIDVASARPWRECRYSSNWNGSNASKRMMNLVSPKFGETKVKEYLDWQVGIGCDHVHLLLVNEADGEGAGYDALADASARKTALKRVKQIRARGMGVVAWIVADDSNGYRKKVFADPAKYAAGLKEYMPYLSYIVLGLEMNEGEGSAAKWKALRDAIKDAGWDGKFATHHTSGKATYAGLGEIVMDQLDPSCSTSDIAKSVKALKSKGYEVCGFEYSRGPDASKAKAALDAGAFSCGNWKGSGPVVAPSAPANGQQITQSADEVDFSALDWCWGGFNGKKAELVSGAQIGSLKVTGDGMSYKWVRGGCEQLDKNCSHKDPCCTCALFCFVDGKWVGGKWEHISSDRTTRAFSNIKDGYGGWDASALSKATEFAFVILDDGAKRRTNVIKAGR